MNNPNEQNSVSYAKIQEIMKMPDAWFRNPTYNDLSKFSYHNTLEAFSTLFPDYYEILKKTNFRYDKSHLYFDDIMVIDKVLKGLPHDCYEIFEDNDLSKGNVIGDTSDIFEIVIMHYNDTLQHATTTEVLKQIEESDDEE